MGERACPLRRDVPAHAGVSPAVLEVAERVGRRPRSRGGEPSMEGKADPAIWTSPLTRG